MGKKSKRYRQRTIVSADYFANNNSRINPHRMSAKMRLGPMDCGQHFQGGLLDHTLLGGPMDRGENFQGGLLGRSLLGEPVDRRDFQRGPEDRRQCFKGRFGDRDKSSQRPFLGIQNEQNHLLDDMQSHQATFSASTRKRQHGHFRERKKASRRAKNKVPLLQEISVTQPGRKTKESALASPRGEIGKRRPEKRQASTIQPPNDAKRRRTNESSYQARKPLRTPKCSQLEDLLQKEPHELLLTVSDPQSKIMGALYNCGKETLDISMKHIPLVLNVLARVVTCEHSNEALNSFLRNVLSTPFFESRLPSFVQHELLDMMLSSKWTADVGLGCIKHLMEVMLACFDRMPNAAFERLHLVLLGLDTIINQIDEDERFIVEDDVKQTYQQLIAADKMTVKAKLAEWKPKSQIITSAQALRDNFRDYPVAPVKEDLDQLNDDVFLRANVVQGKYESVDDYLDIQFRLMREDFISPLRKGVNGLRNLDVELRSRKPITQVYVYRQAFVKYPMCRETGVVYVVKFDGSRYHKSWGRNKRLKYGSLLCFFSQDYSRALFATVVDRDIEVLIERSEVTVKFITENIADNQLSEEFIMIESSAFFEAYVHVLARLKAFTAANFPFAEHIVLCNNEVLPPEYLVKNDGYQYDFKCIISNDVPECGPIMRDPLDLSNWPEKEVLGLDESQYEAIKTAVSHRIALIQGPPGTGKTFIGLKISHLLLKNVMKSGLISGPILVVCYTNHALDQFVEGIASFSGIKIARVGGRCQSEALKRFQLKELKKRYFSQGTIPFGLRRQIGIVKEGIENLYSDIMDSSAHLHAAEEHLLTFHALQPFVPEELLEKIVGPKGLSAGSQQKMKEWLLGLSKKVVHLSTEEEEAVEQVVSDLVAEVVLDYCVHLGRKRVGDDVEEGELDDDEVKNEYGELLGLFEDESDFEEKIRHLDENEDNEQTKSEFQKRVTKLMNKEFINLEEDEIIISKEKSLEKSKARGKALRKMTRKELQSNDCMSDEDEKRITSPLLLVHQQKWRLYRLWRQRYCLSLKSELDKLLEDYNTACRKLQELRAHVDRVVMGDQDVIALTTTGAARYGNMLNILQPKIVIIEEAAEVFESHVVASLSRGCEHLILIGDHKQLRPLPNAFAMAKRFNLDVSLFERLIRNDFHHNTLKMQHRMRPEISRLLRQDSLYPDLEDHPSVTNLDAVEGVTRNLFFIDHQEKETRDEQIQSFRNTFEARYVVRLCFHLLMQGYRPENITILTLYAGQLFELRRQFAKKQVSCKDLKVTVVDNYQGEENDIVILSLIRSNDDRSIGFVGVNNRICVAISRARQGLYVIGNFSLFRRCSPLWANILRMADEEGAVGPSLALRCQMHPNVVMSASSAEDFNRVSPEGGCLEPCTKRLGCGHVCVNTCHPYDRLHQNYKCRKPCVRRCRNGHPCEKLCSAYCGDCKVPVNVLLKSCGHNISVPCYKSEERDLRCNKECSFVLPCGHQCQNRCGEEHSVKCTSLVSKRSPFCGHKVRVKCSSDIKDVKCSLPCKTLLDCGHACSGSCFDCCEGRLHIACNVKCQRTLICGHVCGDQCARGCPPCGEICQLRCIHAKCDRRCGEPCVKCNERCLNSCRHRSCEKLCWELCDIPPCNQPCNRKFRCRKCKRNVLCPGLCGEKCIHLCRSCDADDLAEIFFGSEDEPEARFIRLDTCKHVFEVTGLDQWIHSGKSGSVGVNQCPRCKTPITMMSCKRYLNEVRRNITDLENVKRQMDAGAEEHTWEEKRKKLMRDIEFLNNLENVRLLSKRSLFYSMFEERLKSARFMYDVLICENIFNLLVRLEKQCKKFMNSPRREVIHGMSEEYQLHSDHFLNGLLNAFLRSDLSESALERCSMETLRFGDMLSIMQLICASYKKPSLLDDSMTLWQECITSSQDSESATYTESKHERILRKINNLEIKLGLTLAINEEERVEILKAMNLKQGHWYKCQNGHIYAIGDCGGAVMQSKCPECGLSIGGNSHTLAQGNTFAPEMDGATNPAWSDQMNLNLGNEHLFD